ncbi:type II toxin-antitoxin system death-on-curing family toxin [Candidatus Uhrbacteria bacterium]|nr:type II toxin-antitoxin system death-on-curing family toxin [Candidatus Uhrbacteria bacterium]
MPIFYIDERRMQELCHDIALKAFDKDEEPISPYENHSPGLLDASLKAPMQTFGTELYPTLSAKAAILHYSLIKNHPFGNGNKRIATASLLVFLYVNGYWIYEKYSELADLAINIATSDMSDMDNVVNDSREFIEQNMRKLSE